MFLIDYIIDKTYFKWKFHESHMIPWNQFRIFLHSVLFSGLMDTIYCEFTNIKSIKYKMNLILVDDPVAVERFCGVQPLDNKEDFMCKCYSMTYG